MKQLKFITTTLLLIITSISFGQGFEGEIKFQRINTYDTTDYTYYVGHGKVKIDELDKKGKVMGTMIVDLKSKSVTSISHDRKMYMDVKTKPSTKDLSKCETFKTTDKKVILGQKCTKWVVKNADLKSNAEYWVVDDANFFFFKDLLTALNRKDKIALYFMQIPENAGYFPIFGEEKGLDGKLKAQLKTVSIKRHKVSENTFKIPEGYKKFN